MPDPSTAAVPTPDQLRWLEAELGLFCHFGINTFFDREWSDGTRPASGFQPTDFSAEQWVEVAKAGGFGYVVLTAKHHDGFCNWPTDTTDYSVASSPWRGGKGDVVAELAEACRDAGVKLGLYLSPWDRHEPCYEDAEAYDDFYCRQLTELCTRYGELFELWFDGAGSEGRAYDWGRIMDVVAEHQPHAMVFNMGRPTIRWVGNEDGLAPDPNYYACDKLAKSAFAGGAEEALAHPQCLPAECDVPIRLNWFWHADDLDTLKSVEHLLAIYYRSVGRGANLLLNMGPDTRGRISDADADRWREVRDELSRRFATPISANLAHAADRIRLSFDQPVSLDHLVLEEELSDGQLIDGFEVVDDAGRDVTAGVTVGHKRILAFPRRSVRSLELRLATPGGRLRSAQAHHTGHESLPEVGRAMDYDKWGEKADPKHA